MTKIQIDDGKEQKPEKQVHKKTVKKITVTDAPIIEEKVEKETQPKPAKKSITHQASHPVSSSATHSVLQKSTTLSRRYVKKPGSKTSAQNSAAKASTTSKAKTESLTKSTPAVKIETRKTRTFARIANKTAARNAEKAEKAASRATKIAAKKERAATRLAEKRMRAEREEALRAAKLARAKAEKEARLAREKAEKAAKAASKIETASTLSQAPKMQTAFKKKHRARRIFFALVCSGATVAALVAFVHFSIPDLSVRVAAIQTGIEATYPSFIPRNYNLSNVTSDKDGIVIMTFDGPEGAKFTLSEEKSTWDSTALLNNYVKKTYPSDFTTLREQGITIYVRGEKASWVNGGLLYKIESSGKYLTKEQIRNIATSL